ncbi:GGDEF domain-containing protein [Thalassotalea sp. LPB0316]|uniref:GGDEF domain-containing protein n=1 Tax=Thalassotalea sp. LPB0316 TaxID=2769490 RepID=UPI0018670DB8|nr:GGDEF domain-containing protein [Thalassotalea sp. LPB0316]QOL25317.1 GGDEF domain-containing protein [Thalassotalea sp. LPB0316]
MDWWQKFISLKSSEEVELKRKKLVFYMLSYLCSLIILYFANQQPDSYLTLQITLNVVGLFFIVNALCSHFHRYFQTAMLTGAIGIGFLVIYLAYSGGHENTGLYWILPFPIVYFVFFGYFRGLVANILVYLVLIILLLNPENLAANYRSVEISRFLAAYLVAMILCLIAEYFRFQSYIELSVLNLKKQRQANTDSLTGLPNRRFIDSVLLESATIDPEKYFPMTVIIADIDHFKQINDTYGHNTGDQALIQLSELLKANCRGDDIVARIGGEEFLIVFPQTSVTIGLSICEKLRQLVEQTPIKDAEHHFNITASFGISQALTLYDFEEAKKHADVMLYEAKAGGRNQVRIG